MSRCRRLPLPPGPSACRPMLAASGASVTAGRPVVPGIGRGRAVRIDVFAVPDSIPLGGATDPDAEAERLEAALEGLKVRYDERLAHAGASVEADVLKAHRSVARDPEFGRRLLAEVRDARRTAAGAIAAAERHFTLMLFATGSALLADRALDIRDVCLQLLRELYGEKVRGDDGAADRRLGVPGEDADARPVPRARSPLR